MVRVIGPNQLRIIFGMVLGAIFLDGCAPNYVVLVKNPQTGDLRECRRDPLKNWTWEERRVVDACVHEYEKAGYVEVK